MRVRRAVYNVRLVVEPSFVYSPEEFESVLAQSLIGIGASLWAVCKVVSAEVKLVASDPPSESRPSTWEEREGE